MAGGSRATASHTRTAASSRSKSAKEPEHNSAPTSSRTAADPVPTSRKFSTSGCKQFKKRYSASRSTMRSLRSNGTDDRDGRSSLSRSSRRYNIRDPYHPNYNTPNRSQTDSGNRIPSYVVINRTNPTPSLDSPTSTTPYPSSRSSSNGVCKNSERPLTHGHGPVPNKTFEQRDRLCSVGKPIEQCLNGGRKTGSSSCPDCLHERPPGWQSSLPVSTSQLDGAWECDVCGSSSLGTSMIPIPGSWNNSWMSGYIPANPHPL